MRSIPMNILLADDDADDRFFFKEALAELLLNTHLNSVNDGEQLMQLITQAEVILPDIIFLDLNMPRKNGLECLMEIKLNPKLKSIPIIIFSTSFEQHVVNRLYAQGAHYFIRKPAEFSQFKNIIQQTVYKIMVLNGHLQPAHKDVTLTA